MSITSKQTTSSAPSRPRTSTPSTNPSSTKANSLHPKNLGLRSLVDPSQFVQDMAQDGKVTGNRLIDLALGLAVGEPLEGYENSPDAPAPLPPAKADPLQMELLGGLHTGLAKGGEGLMHLLGLAGHGAQYVANGVSDVVQGGVNLGVDGLQALGVGPSEEWQANTNALVDAKETERLALGKKFSENASYVAPEFGDAVADAGLKTVGALGNTVIDLWQGGVNLVADGQEAVEILLNESAEVPAGRPHLQQGLQQRNTGQGGWNQAVDHAQQTTDASINAVVNRDGGAKPPR